MSAFSTVPSPRDNRLLAALPREDFERLLPQLVPYRLARDQILYESGRAMEHLYFPTSATVSLIYTMLDGTVAAMGLAGNEGVVGSALFMGSVSSPNQAIVQVAGNAFGLAAESLGQEFQRGGVFQQVLLRYTQALITQISQTAVCNRLHTVEQRLCRWLLLSHDRVSTDTLRMTHEFVAQMLGVRRASVTTAARHLQQLGLIRYLYGHVSILDRPGLEVAVCECYQVVQVEYVRLLG